MKLKPRTGLALGAALILGVAALALPALHRGPAAAEEKTDPQVHGETVSLPSSSAALLQIATVADAAPQPPRLPGRLSWDEDRTARVLTPFAGRVAKILVKPGDHVRSGQPLALLYSPEFGAAQADARKAQATLQLAQRNRLRQQDLYEHGVVAAKDLEQAQADELGAQAEHDRTLAQLRLAGDVRETVDQQFSLRSPVAGVVVERNINPGQELRPDQPGAPLFVVTDPDSLWVLLDATQAAAPAGLARGAALSLQVQELPDQRFAAQLEDIADFFDPQTRTVKLRGRFDNRQSHLKGGTYITAELPAPATQAPAAPASTAFLLGQDYYVFVAGSGGYTRRKVGVEFDRQGSVLFKSGVQPGERLVADGALFLERILEQNRDSEQTSATPGGAHGG